MQSDASLAAAIDALEPPYKPTMVSIGTRLELLFERPNGRRHPSLPFDLFHLLHTPGHEIGNLPDKIEDQQKAVMTLEKALVKVSFLRLAPSTRIEPCFCRRSTADLI